MKASREKMYCAFCKNPKYVRVQKHITWTNGLLCLLTSLCAMFVFWQSFDPRFLLIFACFLGISELFIYMGWRLSVRCESCSFDPVLYRNNPAKAADQVKVHLEELRRTGKYLLKRNNPFTHLPVQKKPAEKPLQGPENTDNSRILSRQI